MDTNLVDTLVLNAVTALVVEAQTEEQRVKAAKYKADLEREKLLSMTPDEKLANLRHLGFPARARMAAGQASNSVLLLPPAQEPHNLADMVEAGKYLPHPSGKFVRP